MNIFNTYHPISNFLYFAIVIILSMLFSHPVLVAISLICSITYSIILNGNKSLKFALIGAIPTIILALIINAAFSHAGTTILCYLPDGNPLTLESIIYGAISGARIVSVIFWFSCFNAIITSDKIVYLFCKITPSLSLVLSMTLRFVPRFKAEARQIINANRALGIYSEKGFFAKLKGGARALSTLIGVSLEDSISISDSMHRRGYGTCKRTAYSIFKFELRDSFYCLLCFLLTAVSLFGYFKGLTNASYFPFLNITYTGIGVYSLYLDFALLCLMPIIITIEEDLVWKYSLSKI